MQLENYVSTGTLPSPESVQAWVTEAYTRFRSDTDGAVSSVYPSLADVPAELFGICVATVGGRTYEAGDASYGFTMMSVTKPFVFALVCDAIGPDAARQRLGVNATGRSFNSLSAVEQSADGRTNPMVNAGALAATSLVPGGSADAKWAHMHAGLSRFAGRTLTLDEDIYACASDSNHRNRSIAFLLHDRGRLYASPVETLDLYTRVCSLTVSARDMAVMGATLADGGVNPLTGDRVITEDVCRCVLAAMTTAGMYETSGDWLYDIGLPGKSGIGGGIVTVCPGKGAIGTFAPPLDAAGNSVRGQLATAFLSRRLGLDLFASKPVQAAGRGRT